MSEAMTIENILEAYWILEAGGYWTQTRFPFQTEKGGWSDFDSIAYSPQKKHLVISEAKAQGKKKTIYVTYFSSEHKFKSLLEKFGKSDSYLSFIQKIRDGLPNNLKERIRSDAPEKQIQIKKLTIQLVSNWIFYLEDAEQDVSGIKRGKECMKNELKNMINEFDWIKNPNSNIRVEEVECLIDTPIEIFAEILKRENCNEQGRRYGNDILDLARELNRFSKPTLGRGYGEKIRGKSGLVEQIKNLGGIKYDLGKKGCKDN